MNNVELEETCRRLERELATFKNVEVRFRETEGSYQKVLDAFSEMVFVKGPKSKLVWANKAFRDFYGMSNEQLQGMIDSPINNPDYTLKYIKDDAYVFETGKTLNIADEAVVRHDGVTRYFETLKSAVRNVTGDVILTLGVSRDITERKRSARNKNTEFSVAKILASTASFSEAMQDILSSFCDLQGFSAGELWLMDLSSSTLRKEAVRGDKAKAPFSITEASVNAVTDSGQMKWSDHSIVFPLKAGGRIVGVMGFVSGAPVCRDDDQERLMESIGNQIGQSVARHQSDMALKTEKEKIASILNTAPMLICTIGLDMRIGFVNEAFTRMTSLSEARAVGQKWTDIFISQEGDGLTALFLKAPGATVKNYETNWSGNDGARGIISWDMVCRSNGPEGATDVLAIGSDVTETKRLHESMRQSEKLASVGQLAAGVAHEINNPLGVILGFAQIISARIPADSPDSLPVRSIEREAIRCSQIVKNLLAFSRTSNSHQVKEIQLNDALKNALSLVRANAKLRNIDIVEDFAADLPRLFANETQLQQVVINLCQNGIDAMPDHGRLTIKSDSAVQGGLKGIRLAISDNGSGIPSAILSKIFDPFFTTKEVGKGTGLGLSLVHEIVTSMGGTISVESKKGQGAVFTIFLPAR